MDGVAETSAVGTATEATVTADTLTAEEAVETVQDQNNETVETQEAEAKYTEEDLQRIVQERVAREQAKAQEAAEEAKKLAKMSAQEKLQHQLDKANARVAEMERNAAISGLKSTATQILSESGVTADDALLNILVTDDAETTNNNIKSFIAIVDAKSDELLRTKLKGNAPKVVTNATGATAKSKAEIMAIPDMAERQAEIARNIHLFE